MQRMLATSTIITLAALMLAGCGDKKDDTAKADPYDVYLENNPDPSMILSREDAQTRAYLGCSTTWAPETVDYVLHEAYADLCGTA